MIELQIVCQRCVQRACDTKEKFAGANWKNPQSLRIMMAATSSTQSRAAGLNERRCIGRDIAGVYGSIVTMAKYRAPGASSPVKEEVESALRTVVEEHAALRRANLCFSRADARLFEEAKSFRFEPAQ